MFLLIIASMPRIPKRLRLVLAAALLAVPVASHATLGQDEASADYDRTPIHARRSVRAAAGYTVHEIQLDSGTAVREYVSPSGRIFAIAWRGPTLPDLAQIMGESNYQTFLHAPESRHVPRRLRMVQRDDLVVHSAGRPRAFSGHAYVPALVPPGFPLEDLR